MPIFFTTNPSDYARLPGMYVSEVNPPGFIAQAALGVLGVIGQTLRGPVDTPVEIDSPARFTEVFGDRGRFGSSVELNFVRQFLMNKTWGRYVVVRAAATAAAAASRTFNQTATPVLTVTASSAGSWGADLAVDIVAATDADANHFDLIVNYRGTTTRYQNLNISGTNDNLVTVVGTDIGRLVTLIKVAAGRPDNIAAAALNGTAGSDGTIADADYTGAGRALDKIKNYQGVGLVAIADRQTAAVKSAMNTAAAASADRLFLIWNGNAAETQANVDTDAALYRSSDRLIYCTNSPFTFDQDIGAEVQTYPHAAMANILANTDVNVDPIQQGNKRFTAWITRLTNDGLTRAEQIAHREAGVCALVKADGGGFAFSDGVVNFLTAGRTRITRRRCADFIIMSLATGLLPYVGEENSAATRIQMGGDVVAFLTQLRDVEKRIVEDFAVDQTSQNTPSSRAQGIEVIMVQVKLIAHILSLVLKAQIGETVTIAEAA